MKAVVYNQYGGTDVLQLAQKPEPSARPGLARVRVHAAGLNPKDVLLRKGKMRWLGASLPHTPGYDIAGTLLDEADGLQPGEEVFGMIQSQSAGGCAQLVSLPIDQLAKKPQRLSMEEAAAIPLAALTALQGLRDELGLQAGQRVLLNGASGGVGTFAVQIAKAMGAQAIAVCSAKNESLVRGLGADRVVDYQTESPAELRELDHVFDIFGTLPWEKAKRCLKPGGRYCTTIPKPGDIARGALRKLGLHRAALVVVKSRRSDLDQLRRWVDEGALKPVIDRVVSLEDSAEGHARLETKRARGKVVVRILD